MKILHVSNWCSGVTARNVNALKQWSTHQHELVARTTHPYDLNYEMPTYTEASTTKEIVLGMAEEADALHFDAVGYDGTPELRETIHGIDWSQFLGKKRFVLTGHCSMLTPDGSAWIKPCGRKFDIDHLDKYDLLMGPALSCRHTYAARLEYAPDMIPIFDWLYTPLLGEKPQRACSFKCGERVYELRGRGIDFVQIPCPTKMPIQMDWRRREVRASADNYTDGHWGLFGLESLSQGTPCATYTHPMNRECWDILGVPPPPFIELAFGGANLAETMALILYAPESAWRVMSAEARSWMEKHYDPEILVRRWDDLYNKIA